MLDDLARLLLDEGSRRTVKERHFQPILDAMYDAKYKREFLRPNILIADIIVDEIAQPAARSAFSYIGKEILTSV